MFKQLLASVGVGAARLDTRLVDDTVMPGGQLSGSVLVQGGDVAQEVETLYLSLVTHYKREVNDRMVTEECVLGRYPIVPAFLLEANETRTVPFTLHIPFETPLTIGRQPVYLRSSLAISRAVDRADTDQIRVQPHPLQQKMFEALDQLGFQLSSVENEYNRKWRGSYPFVQEFEFRPVGKYRKRLEELEVIFQLHAHGLEVLLELDKRARGLARLFADFDLNERYAQLQFSNTDLARHDWAAMLDRVIHERLR